MTSGFHLKNRLGLGFFTALAAVAVLGSCNQDMRSAAGPDKEGIEYITVEYVQAPPELRNEQPSFFVDLPKGFEFAGSQIEEGDIVSDPRALLTERRISTVTPFQQGIKDYRMTWPSHALTLSMWVVSLEQDSGEYSISSSQLATIGQEVIEERQVTVGAFSGSVVYTRYNADLLGEDESGAYDTLTGDIETVHLLLQGDTHLVTIHMAIDDKGESMPEMMDIAIHIAKSIRIKEESANDD